MGDTLCKLTFYRLLKSAVDFHGFPPDSSSVGEAETGSGGDQWGEPLGREGSVVEEESSVMT